MEDEVNGAAPEARKETAATSESQEEAVETAGKKEGAIEPEPEVQTEGEGNIGEGKSGEEGDKSEEEEEEKKKESDVPVESEAQDQEGQGEDETSSAPKEEPASEESEQEAKPEVQEQDEEGEKEREASIPIETEAQEQDGEAERARDIVEPGEAEEGEEGSTTAEVQVQVQEEGGEGAGGADTEENKELAAEQEARIQGEQEGGVAEPEPEPEGEQQGGGWEGGTGDTGAQESGEPSKDKKVSTVSTLSDIKLEMGEDGVPLPPPETEIHYEETIEEVTLTVTYIPSPPSSPAIATPSPPAPSPERKMILARRDTLELPQTNIEEKAILVPAEQAAEEVRRRSSDRSIKRRSSEGDNRRSSERSIVSEISDGRRSSEGERRRSSGGEPYTQVLEPVGEPTISSRVETASPGDAFKDQDKTFHHPLSLHWSFGYNSKLPVHNISEGNRKMIFYASAHTGVLLDCINNKQCLLQGHNNPISCTAVSGDRRWLATADSGKDCVLIVWDSFSGIPLRTIFDGMGEGTVAIAISPDSQYLVTLSAGKSQSMQDVRVWDWTVESDGPLCQVSLGPDYSYQTFVTFHTKDPYQLVSNSEDLVVFYTWKEKEMKVHAHPILDKDFNRTIGRFYQSVFVPNSTLALTGTSEGHGIVWENEGGDDEPHVKKGVKLTRLHDCPLTVVTSTLNMVVTGDVEGRIKFFDNKLKMINWYEDVMKYGPLYSISFAFSPNIALLKSSLGSGKSAPDAHSYPLESTKVASPFVIPDFTTSTTSASIVYYTSSSSTAEVLFNEHDASVNALAAHPFMPHLLTSGNTCRLKLWDYETKLVLGNREFTEPVQCACFDPKGEFISIGFTSGTLQVLDAITLSDIDGSFLYSRAAITKIAFSHDSSYMATADLDKCVSVLVAQPDEPQKPWRFLAKYRSHFKTIESLMFGVKLDSNVPRLLSLGSDRKLIEYDLTNSTDGNLILMSNDRIEQSAVPRAMAWYPPLTTESFILMTNDQYKIKLYNSTTKMCRQTLLGPMFGSPLRKVIVLPAPIVRDAENQEVRRYLAYCTNNKVGLLLLPHDGNPHNSKCLVAHPGKVADMTCSFDGKYIFTTGGEDCTVNMWTINTEALEAASLLGGEDLQPFYAMLDGGRDGEFFNELEEYFYYAQIRSQGPDVTAPRKVSTTIPIEEIPYVMRAIGYYPSEQEIDDMLNEVKFGRFVDKGSYVTKIDLGTFIRLYINHRPVFGLTPLQVGKAFRVLGDKLQDERYWSVDRGELLTLLHLKGEHMTEAEIVEYLMTLLGYSDNPEVDSSYTEDVGTALEQIPERISAPLFAEEIIGLSTH